MGNGFGCFLNIGSEVQVILFGSISVFNIIANYDLCCLSGFSYDYVFKGC